MTATWPPAGVQPWAAASAADLAAVRGVFTDIDDTLTEGGAITPEALSALETLCRHRVPVVAITGRPMGWSEPFARDWPVAAIVAENGAVALIPERGALHIEYAQDEATRNADTVRLQAAAQRVLREVPGTALARDSAGRVTDIAIDHSEFAHLPPQVIAQGVRVMQDEGMNATVSSIHINGWFGEHTKLSGADWMLRRLFGRTLDDELARWVYVGDSTNDQLMFGRFPLSVGVANLRQFAQQLDTWPRYVTQGERGAGFAEVAQRLVAGREAA